MSSAPVLDAFSRILETRGLAEGLAFLNDRVPHRYTAVYRYAGLILKNVCLHDALGKRLPPFLSALPLNKSLAQFVRPGSPFRTDDSTRDPRLAGHAYDGILFSYHGTALVAPGGHSWGVLCHFDFTPVPLSDPDFEFLEAVAPMVADFAVDPHR
ncbi:GAF domain-containing protein [Variovorax sp. J22P240]|uniref:GAF domain-containing protein n=1 Tax=unclassified Variovorax TaxID=663243 RepID=UPI002574FDD0|nr:MULTISPECIES: GAF domain-containing protein [unclassified Variovorax]MDL9999314.1 GAF domain-containing protein [Variovorax sp. J22P240]MDM0052570.1 GAF domain-containing protein [Variovorax sp. J22R115]